MKIKSRRIRRQEFWGAHAPWRADFGALAEIFSYPMSTAAGKVRDREARSPACEARALPG